ncbi:MAG: hypothetical protein OEZ06_30870 [Myxococcales bacterium]|nr:hypothetical protein [Myxococcales bacterium]
MLSRSARGQVDHGLDRQRVGEKDQHCEARLSRVQSQALGESGDQEGREHAQQQVLGAQGRGLDPGQRDAQAVAQMQQRAVAVVGGANVAAVEQVRIDVRVLGRGDRLPHRLPVEPVFGQRVGVVPNVVIGQSAQVVQRRE